MSKEDEVVLIDALGNGLYATTDEDGIIFRLGKEKHFLWHSYFKAKDILVLKDEEKEKLGNLLDFMNSNDPTFFLSCSCKTEGFLFVRTEEGFFITFLSLDNKKQKVDEAFNIGDLKSFLNSNDTEHLFPASMNEGIFTLKLDDAIYFMLFSARKNKFIYFLENEDDIETFKSFLNDYS